MRVLSRVDVIAIVAGAGIAASTVWALFNMWRWSEGRVDDATTCVQLVFDRRDFALSSVEDVVELIVKQNHLPWMPSETPGLVFSRDERTALHWNDKPPTNRPEATMLMVCGRGRSSEWQSVAKNAETMLAEKFHLLDATLILDPKLHVNCRAGESCHVKVPLPLNFSALIASLLVERTS